MKITLLCVGKIKETYFKAAIDEYAKRLSKYVDLSIIEVPDEKAPETLSLAEEEILKAKEGDKLLKHISSTDFVAALAINGKSIDSPEFSSFFNTRMVSGISKITFVIGGSLGLSPSVLSRADYLLSFSKMTFPHQLMRVVLLEQVYRGMKILKGEPYHK